MFAKVEFTYKGVTYLPGSPFDLSVLEDEDRNDIFIRRNLTDGTAEQALVEQPVKKVLKKKASAK